MEQRATAVNQQASLCELSWLGGIIDGEGCVTVDKRTGDNVFPAITIVNTDHRITDKVEAIFKRHAIAYYFRVHPANGNWKPRRQFIISGWKRVSRALPVILPYLVSKADRAELIIKLCDMRLKANRAPYSEAEKDICRQVWELNGRGTNHWTTQWKGTQKPQRVYVGDAHKAS
jgi:hypothetical protein